jgi:hypothetical protein
MILLESVGCFFDPEDGMTYPAFANGKPDLSNGVHLDEIDNDEWHSSLSVSDHATVFGA